MIVGMQPRRFSQWLVCVFLTCGLAAAQEAQVVVHANQVCGRVSRYLTGACIEDVNHEIYGGLYSQTIFGESFQEPPPTVPPMGFAAYSGRWLVQDGVLWADGGDGPKLIADQPVLGAGEVGVDIFLPVPKGGNAGLILKVSGSGVGADNFTGYEVSLESGGRLVLGRHRQNWEPIRNVPCAARPNQWVSLVVRLAGDSIEVLVDGKTILAYEDREHPLTAGRVGLRTWQREARFRNLYVRDGGPTRTLRFEPAEAASLNREVSGMWRPLRRGSGTGEWGLDTQDVFTGRQSQRLTFKAGEGEVGIENQGLNRWGMNFVKGQPYEGYVWLRAKQPVRVFFALESADGSKVYAETAAEVRTRPVAANQLQAHA